jgi:hypothetical protein
MVFPKNSMIGQEYSRNQSSAEGPLPGVVKHGSESDDLVIPGMDLSGVHSQKEVVF